MEVRHDRRSNNTAEAERRAFIGELWIELGEPAVDARLLKTILTRMVEAFGNDVLGPAAIARLLADQGAELKHPEIIEMDAEWRERQTAGATDSGLEQLARQGVMTLPAAETFIAGLEALRKQYEVNADRQALAQVRTMASESRRLAESIARNQSAEQTVRAEQAEIAEWLKVWLQTPSLFGDWLELRRRSDQFRASFPGRHHEDTKKQSD